MPPVLVRVAACCWRGGLQHWPLLGQRASSQTCQCRGAAHTTHAHQDLLFLLLLILYPRALLLFNQWQLQLRSPEPC